jgi:hypothetical protein
LVNPFNVKDVASGSMLFSANVAGVAHHGVQYSSWYPVTTEPPFDNGARQFNVTDPSDGETTSPCTALGVVIGVPEMNAGAPEPA